MRRLGAKKFAGVASATLGYFTAGLSKAAPRKRPAHALSAVVMGHGDEAYALGASAGHYRAAIYVQLIQNVVSYGMDPRQAVWAPVSSGSAAMRCRRRKGGSGGEGCGW